jgi:enduracididine biosynthesis enzyme MppQ
VTGTKGGSPHWHPQVVQIAEPAGVIDLGPGHLDPDLLPVRLLRDGYLRAFDEYGPAALTYGHDRGPLPLRQLLARHGGAGVVDPDQVLITAGITSALALLVRLEAAPGDAVFAEAASYDLAMQLFRDHGLHVCQVPGDALGMDPAALARAVDAEQAAGRRPRLLYVIPNFQNPTGRVLGQQRRRELVAIAAQRGLLLLEDDPYGWLSFDGTEPPVSLGELAGYAHVVRLGSFSKVLAPGLRLGWLVCSPAMADRLATTATFTSGGGLNHLASVAVTGIMADGLLSVHLAKLRTQLRARRDTLVAGLRGHLDFRVPTGGFFLWSRLPSAERAEAMVRAAALAGVPVSSGSRFGDASAIRLCYSFQSPARLAEAADRLSLAWSASSPTVVRPGVRRREPQTEESR